MPGAQQALEEAGHSLPMEGGTEGGREGGREGGMEGGRKEGGREGGRKEGGRGGGTEGRKDSKILVRKHAWTKIVGPQTSGVKFLQIQWRNIGL